MWVRGGGEGGREGGREGHSRGMLLDTHAHTHACMWLGLQQLTGAHAWAVGVCVCVCVCNGGGARGWDQTDGLVFFCLGWSVFLP